MPFDCNGSSLDARARLVIRDSLWLARTRLRVRKGAPGARSEVSAIMTFGNPAATSGVELVCREG